jgi:hypothetical protein
MKQLLRLKMVAEIWHKRSFQSCSSPVADELNRKKFVASPGYTGPLANVKEYNQPTCIRLEPMKPDYLDAILFGLLGLIACGAFYRMAPHKAARPVAIKERRKETTVVVRRPRNWRW